MTWQGGGSLATPQLLLADGGRSAARPQPRGEREGDGPAIADPIRASRRLASLGDFRAWRI